MAKHSVLAAVNVDGKFYAAGSVVDVDAAIARPLVDLGYLDGSKEAVAAREASGADVIKHTRPKPETADDAGAKNAEKR